MNWHKAKTILICFLIVTNLFLLFNIIFNGKSDNYISNDILTYTAEILNNNGIKISTDLIPSQHITVSQFEADNIIADYDTFAKGILGESPEKKSENTYKSDIGVLEFSGDGFCFTSSAPLYSGELNENDALSLLKNLSVELNDYEFEKNESGVIFKNKANKLDIFNSEICIENIGTQTHIAGIWFNKYGDNFPNSPQIKPVTTVLIDFLSSPEKPQTAEITALTFGYITYESDIYHKSIVPIPVWKIEFADRAVYIDARANN